MFLGSGPVHAVPDNSFKPNTNCYASGVGLTQAGPVLQINRILLTIACLSLSACVGRESQPLAECPKTLSVPRMPDLPPTKGFYQGKVDAKYTIQESGRVSDISVAFPELTLDRKSVDLGSVTHYAIESLRTRQFQGREEPCVVKFSAWIN